MTHDVRRADGRPARLDCGRISGTEDTMENWQERPDFRAIADKIVKTSLRIRPGEVVQLGGGVHNFDLLAALAAGGAPGRARFPN